MKRFAIVIEKAGGNFGAYVPDLPGCVTTGDTVDEVKRNIVEAIELHLHGIREEREPIPLSETQVDYVEVPDDPEAWAKGVQPAAHHGAK